MAQYRRTLDVPEPRSFAAEKKDSSTLNKVRDIGTGPFWVFHTRGKRPFRLLRDFQAERPQRTNALTLPIIWKLRFRLSIPSRSAS
jgi:hypothetical protein